MSTGLVLTARDRALIRATWSLGATTSDVLRQLVSPHTGPRRLRRRLHELCTHRYLRQRRVLGGDGHVYLYTIGPTAQRADPGVGEGWQPSLAQLEHTLAVGRVLATLVTSEAVAPLTITGWQGEAELRSWAKPGDPYPDGRITWEEASRSGAWLLELDRGTEPRAVWRRKLVRYLLADIDEPVLVVTTSRRRAAGIAELAREAGVELSAATFADVESRGLTGLGTSWPLCDSQSVDNPLRSGRTG